MAKTNNGIALSVSHVSKDFYLPHNKSNSIKSIIVNALKHKDKEVDTQHALKDISFEIQKGEFFGILGRNGSGKSTLLKILAEIYKPTTGSVHTNGKLVPFIELGVGFNPELTGRENVYLNGALLGFSRREIDARYDDIVEFAELEEFMDQKLKNYSSGMQVRLAFSVATRADAEILLIDEVLAVGDADFQRKCFQYFKQLKKNKKTVVFVSHDMGAVNEFCDRAVLIDDGVIVATDNAEKIAQAYLGLFNTGENDGYSKQSERWGNNWAKFTKLKVAVDGNTINIDATVKASKRIDNIVYGIRIRNVSGDEIIGTNSTIKGKRDLLIDKDEVVKLKWEFPNVLSNGEYIIDPAITIGDGATVCDWWNNAYNFSVNKTDSTPYIVTPDFNLEIDGGKKS